MIVFPFPNTLVLLLDLFPRFLIIEVNPFWVWALPRSGCAPIILAYVMFRKFWMTPVPFVLSFCFKYRFLLLMWEGLRMSSSDSKILDFPLFWLIRVMLRLEADTRCGVGDSNFRFLYVDPVIVVLRGDVLRFLIGWKLFLWTLMFFAGRLWGVGLLDVIFSMILFDLDFKGSLTGIWALYE